MGALTSRQHAGVEEVDIPSNFVYRYPPKSGEDRARAAGRAEGRPRVRCCGRATRWPGRPGVGLGEGEVFGMQGGGVRSPFLSPATPRRGPQGARGVTEVTARVLGGNLLCDRDARRRGCGVAVAAGFRRIPGRHLGQVLSPVCRILTSGTVRSAFLWA